MSQIVTNRAQTLYRHANQLMQSRLICLLTSTQDKSVVRVFQINLNWKELAFKERGNRSGRRKTLIKHSRKPDLNPGRGPDLQLWVVDENCRWSLALIYYLCSRKIKMKLRQMFKPAGLPRGVAISRHCNYTETLQPELKRLSLTHFLVQYLKWKQDINGETVKR